MGVEYCMQNRQSLLSDFSGMTFFHPKTLALSLLEAFNLFHILVVIPHTRTNKRKLRNHDLRFLIKFRYH